jgi:nucleoside-diphosphate-sugar epimerase
VAVTGAAGAIGRILCDRLRRNGWTVRALVRAPASYPFSENGVERFHLDLPDTVDPQAFEGADVVVHAAYATRTSDPAVARRVNEEGTLRVLAAARAAGVRRFVFISSLSAHPGAASYYGQSKLALEGQMDLARDLVVRPGLVLTAEGGLANRLRGAIARWRIAPLFDGGNQVVQTVHVDDLCAALERAISLDATGVLHVAEPAGLPMRRFLALLAHSAGVRHVPLAIPARPVLALLRASERAGFQLPISAENLLGLVAMRHVDTAADLERLRLSVRGAAESLEDLFGPGSRPRSVRTSVKEQQ